MTVIIQTDCLCDMIAHDAKLISVNQTCRLPIGLVKSVLATLYPMMEADGLEMVPAECDEICLGDTIMWRNI